MSLHRRRLHRWLAIGYLLVAFFAPVAHLHGRGISSSDPARGVSIDHTRLATPGLADRPCDCPACHFSTTQLALIEPGAWFDSESSAAIGRSEGVGSPIHRRSRASTRAPPADRA